LSLSYRGPILTLAALFSFGTFLYGEPPTDPAAKKIYDHDYQWLEKQSTNFIAINIRGTNDTQYPERRQAALDLLKTKSDLTVVPDLMDELRRGSFLSGQICDLLAEWKARKAMPLLKEVSEDRKRPADVREKAKKALETLSKTPPPAPPPKF
jgi:hypothetical protein